MANLEHAEDEPKHVKMSGEISAAGAPVKPAGASALPVFVACEIPSFAAAAELLSAPYSCLVMNTHRRHIALPPKYLKKKRTGIQEELEAELLRFSESLNGVPLAYDSIRIVRQHGDIYNDSGYIHMDIEANFVIFMPKQGQQLMGKVNKLGVSHVGCLVHGCFNASIPKPNLVTVETWRVAGPRIGSELEFEVTALDADTAGVLLIRGRMDRTRVQELLAMGETSQSGVPANQPQPPDAQPTPDPIQEPPEDTPKKKKKKKDKVKEEQAEEEVADDAKQQVNGSADEANGSEVVEKKKKKKKDKVKEEQAEEEVADDAKQQVNGSAGEANGSEVVEKKKKKKKKKKEERLKEEAEEVAVSSVEVHGSDSSGYLSDKPSKKRKHQTSGDATDDVNNHAIPKSKKKRKGGIEQFA